VEPQIRSFNEADVKQMLQLYEEQFVDVLGYIPKTAELWRYFVLDKPGISKENILVAEQEGKICGYIVFGFKKMGGANVSTVYEICATNEKTANVLLTRAFEHTKNKEVDYILVQIPANLPVIHETLREFDFVRMTKPEMKIMVTLIDPTKIVAESAGIFNEHQKTGEFRKFLGKNKQILIRIDDFNVGILLRDGKLTVTDKFDGSADAELKMKAYEFLRIFFCQTSVFREFLARRIKIRGLISNLYIFSLINAMRFQKPFFFPLTDHF
jgi:predicted acetyltransferase